MSSKSSRKSSKRPSRASGGASPSKTAPKPAQPTEETLLRCGRFALLGIEALGQIRKEVLEGLGFQVARGLLTRLGYHMGRKDGARLRALFGGKNEREWFLAGFSMQKGLGQMEVKVEHLDFDRKTGKLDCRGSWRNSFEALEHLSSFGISSHPVCWTLSGYSAGYASEFLGSEVSCSEETCAGAGAGQCSFRLIDLERATSPARSFHGQLTSQTLKGHLEKLESHYSQRVEELEKTGYRDREILRLIVEDSLNGIIAFDNNEIIQFWNRGAETIYGYSTGDVIGKPLSILIPPELQAAGELKFINDATNREGTLRNFVTERVRKDGRRITVQFTRTKILDSSGAPIGSTAVVMDITEMLQIRDRLERVHSLSAIGQTVASIAHDLRSPIQTVRSAADLLRSSSGDPSRVETIAAELEESMNSVERLVDDLLAFSRDQRPGRIPTPVAMLLEATAEEMRGQLPAPVTCIFQVPPEGSPLPCDAFKIKQALMNLIRNAAEAMPGGGTVTVSAHLNQENWSIEVADNGPGIPREVQTKIFEPFYTTKKKGTGLGLAIVRKIVDAHQGALEVDSSQGQGSRFRIILPTYQPTTNLK